MAMNYNDIEAPNFVDFGGNFEDEGEGDSWFSNDSTNFDSADVTLDNEPQVGIFSREVIDFSLFCSYRFSMVSCNRTLKLSLLLNTCENFCLYS